MPIRLRCARRTPAALLLAGLLFLPLFAAPQLTAGEDNSCPAQGCGRRPHSPGAALQSSTKLVRVTYEVADLVIPIPSVVHVPDGPVSGASTTATREDGLIKLITTTVDPRSWSDMGGPGTIDYHPMTMGLVVNQTPDVQEQIQDFLASLRRLQDREVALEVRFLSVDEAFVERLGLDGTGGTEIKASSASDAPLRVNFLDDAQVSRLMEAVQGRRRANVMQPPKPTMFNGQTWAFDATEPKTFVTGVSLRVASNGNDVFQPTVEEIPVGLRMTARPVIIDEDTGSSFRRFVNVSLNVNLTHLDKSMADATPVRFSYTPKGDAPAAFTQLLQHPLISRLSLDGTLKIPDGGTAVISGWKRDREVRTEFGPPVLSEIPYLNRLFKNVGCGRETECVLMLVTPRIIVQEEEEEKCAGTKETGFRACPCEEKGCDAPSCGKRQAAELVEKYHRACVDGRGAEATQLAVQALAIDPACFHADGKPAEPCDPSSQPGR